MWKKQASSLLALEFAVGFPFQKFNGAGRLVKYGGFPDFQLSKGFTRPPVLVIYCLDVVNFEKIVNTSKLLEACSTVDPLKECCRPICQSAIMEAALEISGTQLTINDYKDSVTVPNHNDPPSDCKGVVFSYISRKLSADAASSAFRIVSACKVNKVSSLIWDPHEIAPWDTKPGCSVMENFTQFDGNLDVKDSTVGSDHFFMLKEHLAHKRRMRMIKRKIIAQTMFVDERGHEAGSDQKLHFHENDG
uniref:Uncharacterized protein n=1 Tax=Salix viminalis TaxID=40686 RepID=A0A6N2LEZ1_SALVM